MKRIILLFLSVFMITGCAGTLDGVTRSANAVEALASPASRSLDAVYEAAQKACLIAEAPADRATCVAKVRTTFADALDLREAVALASAQLADTVNKLQAQKSQPTEAQMLTVAAGIEALVIAEGRFLAAKTAAGVH